MGYAKLFSSITESSLWSEPKEVRLLFVTMLARANQIGFVEASVPGLARVANLTMAEVESALTVLMEPDPHSKDLDAAPENEGRRIIKAPGGWLILNYEAYRNRESEEERKEYMKLYMREYRAKQKAECKPSVNTRKHDVNKSKESPSASASVTGKEVGESRGEGEKGPEMPAPLAVPKFQKAWDEFVAYRKEHRFKPLKPSSIEKQWKILALYGPDIATLAIEQSIANGWQGIFPEKVANGTQASGPKLTGRAAEFARQAEIHNKPSQFTDRNGNPL